MQTIVLSHQLLYSTHTHLFHTQLLLKPLCHNVRLFFFCNLTFCHHFFFSADPCKTRGSYTTANTLHLYLSLNILARYSTQSRKSICKHTVQFRWSGIQVLCRKQFLLFMVSCLKGISSTTHFTAAVCLYCAMISVYLTPELTVFNWRRILLSFSKAL